MPKKTLDHNTISGFKAPDNPIEYYDTVEEGLILRLAKSGTKTFEYRYRFHNKNRRYSLGRFPDLNLAKARKLVRGLRVDIGNGDDPQAERDEKKRIKNPVLNFADLCNRYINGHIPSLRPRTRAEYLRIINLELLPKLGKYTIEELSRREIIEILDAIAIGRNAPTLANRVRATLSSMYSFGLDRALVEMNPVLHIKRVKGEQKRDRIYSEDEIRALWQAFRNQDDPVQSLFKMLLICGQRSGETSQMKWEDVVDGIWHIPEEMTKANRSQYLPLPQMALNALETMRPLSGTNKYVFASERADNKPLMWIGKAKDRIRKDSKIEDFRPHDLRRTAASYMAGLGIDRTVLGKVLNHKGLAGDDTVTAIYDRHDYLREKQQALQRWSQKLQKIINNEAEAKIYKIG